MQIQIGHLLEQVAGRRRGGDCNADGLFKALGGFIGAKQGIYSRGGVEVGYFLFSEEAPDHWVVDFSKADVCAADSCECPAECPTCVLLVCVSLIWKSGTVHGFFVLRGQVFQINTPVDVLCRF